MNLIEVAVATHHLLRDHDLRYGFGGALALNYYTDPRATADVDVNVFIPWASGIERLGLFEELGFHPIAPLEEAIPVAGVRLAARSTPIKLDVFFSLDDHYDEVADRLRWFPFGLDGEELPFFSPEDVVVFKISFNRDKDWVDIRRLLEHEESIDLDYVERAAVAIRGPRMHPRVARVRSMGRAARGP